MGHKTLTTSILLAQCWPSSKADHLANSRPTCITSGWLDRLATLLLCRKSTETHAADY